MASQLVGSKHCHLCGISAGGGIRFLNGEEGFLNMSV